MTPRINEWNPAVRHDVSSSRFPATGGRGTALLLDDDEAFRSSCSRVLSKEGFMVRDTSSPAAAIGLLDDDVDVLLCDLVMPGADGLAVLREAKAKRPDLPVVLLTGAPSMESAIGAVELGAHHYLVKPFEAGKLLATVDSAVKMHRLSVAQKRFLMDSGRAGEVADIERLDQDYRGALETLWMAYQPIVSWSERRIVGVEALMRVEHPRFPGPMEVLDAAERLDQSTQLSRHIRKAVAATAHTFPADTLLFVNILPRDVWDPQLLSAEDDLTPFADRIVLELTERAALRSTPELRQRIDALRETGCRVAIDDLGTGYNSLNVFTVVEPDVVKLDMSLVRGIHTNQVKQRLVESVANLCADLDIDVVAEGIETPEERDVLIDLGCDLLQGYLFARPGRTFPRVRW